MSMIGKIVRCFFKLNIICYAKLKPARFQVWSKRLSENRWQFIKFASHACQDFSSACHLSVSVCHHNSFDLIRTNKPYFIGHFLSCRVNLFSQGVQYKYSAWKLKKKGTCKIMVFFFKIYPFSFGTFWNSRLQEIHSTKKKFWWKKRSLGWHVIFESCLKY